MPERDIDRADQAFAQALLPDRLDVAPAGEEGVDHVRVPLDVAPSWRILSICARLSRLRYGRLLDIASKASATAKIRASSGISSPAEMVGVSCSVQAFVVVLDAREDMVQLFQVLENRSRRFPHVTGSCDIPRASSGPFFLSTWSSMPILPTSCKRPVR